MATPFATTDDLSAYLVATGQPALTTAQVPGATMLLAAITQAIRRETGQQITLTTSTVELQGQPPSEIPLARYGGDWGHHRDYGRSAVREDLTLPQQPVQSVSAVLLDDAAVTDWRLRSGALWRCGGWPGWVTVTFTHGYPVTPDDVFAYTVMVGAEALRGAVPVLTEQIVEYSYTRGQTLPGDHLGLGMAALIAGYQVQADVLVRSVRTA